MRVSVPPDLAKAIRASQPRLADARYTSHVSIYHHHHRQRGRRRKPPAIPPITTLPPPTKPSKHLHIAQGLVPRQQRQRQPAPPSASGQARSAEVPPGPVPGGGAGLMPFKVPDPGHSSWPCPTSHHSQRQPRPTTVHTALGCAKGIQPSLPTQPQSPTPQSYPEGPSASLLLSLLQHAWQQQARLHLAVVGLTAQVQQQRLHGIPPLQPAATPAPALQPVATPALAPQPATTPAPTLQPATTPVPPPAPPRPPRREPLGRLSMLMALQGSHERQPLVWEQPEASPQTAAAAFLAGLVPPPPPPPPRCQVDNTPKQSHPPSSPPQSVNPLFAPLPLSPPLSPEPSSRAAPHPPPFPPRKGGDWAVACVKGHQRDNKGNLYYWVQWEDSWVSGSQLVGGLEAEYWQRRGEAPPQGPADGGRQGRSARVRPPQQQPTKQRAGCRSPQALE